MTRFKLKFYLDEDIPLGLEEDFQKISKFWIITVKVRYTQVSMMPAKMKKILSTQRTIHSYHAFDQL